MGAFQRYLRAKRAVDDRSLDRRLVDRLRTGLDRRATDREGPLRVLEIGAGVGTMVTRAIEWDLLPAGDVTYTAVDVDESTVAALSDHLASWAADREVDAVVDDRRIELTDHERTVTVEAVGAEAATFTREASREWDLLVGVALLDLVSLECLPTLLSALAPGGWWYFPITFDGGTRFAPSHPADDAVERQYHRHMDEKPGGTSRAGHHALQRLQTLDAATIAGVAGSDWVVRPTGGEEQTYPGDEAFFLRYILDTVETALGELDRGEALDDSTLADWLATRREQVVQGELTYVTHQLDLLGQVERAVTAGGDR